MGYLEDIWNWLGGLSQSQKFDGLPDSVDQYLGRESGGGTTGARTPLKLDIIGIHGVVDTNTKLNTLLGFYNRSNGRINVDTTEYLIGIISQLYNNGVLTNSNNLNEPTALNTHIKQAQDAGAAGTKTWTPGTGKTWILLDATVANDTHPAVPSMAIDDGSAVFSRTGAVAAAVERYASAMDGGTRFYVLQAGWDLVMTDLAWQAGDTDDFTIHYLEF